MNKMAIVIEDLHTSAPNCFEGHKEPEDLITTIEMLRTYISSKKIISLQYMDYLDNTGSDFISKVRYFICFNSFVDIRTIGYWGSPWCLRPFAFIKASERYASVHVCGKIFNGCHDYARLLVCVANLCYFIVFCLFILAFRPI